MIEPAELGCSFYQLYRVWIHWIHSIPTLTPRIITIGLSNVSFSQLKQRRLPANRRSERVVKLLESRNQKSEHNTTQHTTTQLNQSKAKRTEPNQPTKTPRTIHCLCIHHQLYSMVPLPFDKLANLVVSTKEELIIVALNIVLIIYWNQTNTLTGKITIGCSKDHAAFRRFVSSLGSNFRLISRLAGLSDIH